MTIKEQDPPKVRFVSDGTIVPWPFQWRLFSPTYADLIIEYDGAAQVVDASNFTIDYDEGQEAGSVTAKVAPPNGVIIVMRRKTAVERTADFNNINDFKGKPVNLEFDRFLAIAQEHAEDISRSVRRSAKSGSSANLDLPEPVANRAIKWNAAASGFENSEHDIDTLGDEVAGNKAATDQALADAQAVLAQTQAALTQVQALTVNAQNSAAAAEAAFQAFPAGMVKRISADYAIPVSENGYHYVIDGTGNDVDLIAPLGAEALEPFRFSTQRADSSDNTVRIVASGDNTFNNGQTQIILPYANSGASLKLDVNPEPDNWSVATSGAMSQLQEQIYYFTATAGQTVFTGADDFARTLGFVPGRIEVYRGPFRLWKERGDYSDASGDAVVLDEGAEAGEEITVIARSAFAVADTMSIAEVEAAIAAVADGFIGEVRGMHRKNIPAGWATLNGGVLTVSAYPDFVTECYVGDADNATADFYYRCTSDADPENTRSTTGAYIKLPDLNGSDGAEGVFLRGWNDASGRQWATMQADELKAHTHVYNFGTGIAAAAGSSITIGGNPASTTGSAGGSETRPVNGPIIWCVKVSHATRVPTPGPSGVNKAGDAMTGNLSVPAGTLPAHAVNKGQLDVLRNIDYVETGASILGSQPIPLSNRAPTNLEGNEFAEVTITPSKIGALIEVSVTAHVQPNTANTWTTTALFKDAETSAFYTLTEFQQTSGGATCLCGRTFVVATSTSPLVIHARFGVEGAASYLNGAVGSNFGGTTKSSLMVKEIA